MRLAGVRSDRSRVQPGGLVFGHETGCMARRKEVKPGDPPEKGPVKSGQRATPRAFDIWLDRGLHRMYDSVAQEPVPEDLLRLIKEDQKK